MEKLVIPEGYKQTELGVIPEEWECGPLKEFATFGGGTTPSRSAYDRYYSNGLHPWVKTLDLNNSIIKKTEEKITSAALSEVSIVKHPKGTVLVAMYGGFNQIGRTGLLAIASAINQALVAVKPQHRLSSSYLLFNLNFNVEYWKLVASSSRKDPNITSNDVKNYPLCLPPLDEQTAIANALSDVDALIAGLKKLIAKKQAIKTATMQQLLTGRTRLPEYATHPDGTQKGYKQTELGEIPEDWDSDKLGNLVEITSGESPSQFEFIAEGTPYFKVEQLNNGDVFAGKTPYFIESNKSVAAGSVIFPKRGASILSNKIRVLTFDSFMDTNLMALTCGNRINNIYLYNLLVYQGLDNVADTTSIPQINNKHIVPYLLRLPSYLEQTAIANILSDMDEEIQSLQQRLNKTRKIKQGMMQELLTGKTRLV